MKFFDFFWQEIEAREKIIEELVVAADSLADTLKFDHKPDWSLITIETEKALEKYNELKK